MSKTIRMPLSKNGVNAAINAVREYQRMLIDGSRELLERLSVEGFVIASAGFASAQYDGTNDVQVLPVEVRGENVRAIVAVGASVLFIEFGTGVVYPDDHPEARANGMIRGQYGQGKGRQLAWGYYGDPGTNGKVHMNKQKQEVVVTRGNPANACMYNTVKKLEEMLPVLAREVFHD